MDAWSKQPVIEPQTASARFADKAPEMLEFLTGQFGSLELAYCLSSGVPAVITSIKTQVLWSPEMITEKYGNLVCKVDDCSGKIEPYVTTMGSFFYPWCHGHMQEAEGLLRNKVEVAYRVKIHAHHLYRIFRRRPYYRRSVQKCRKISLSIFPVPTIPLPEDL